jgi:hypothetical protein
MFDNLLTKLLEKVAQEIGGKAASLILDERVWGKRTSFDLYHSLRTLEETLTEAEHALSHVIEQNWSSDRGQYESLNSRVIGRDFVQRFRNSLESAQQAFQKIDDKIEIYGSREDMERLGQLLGLDAEVMYLLHDDYNRDPHTIEQWKKVIGHTREAARNARQILSGFIASKFPI